MKGFVPKTILRNTQVLKTEDTLIRTYKIKMLWLYPFISAAIYLLSSMFINLITVRLILSLVLGFFPWNALTSKMYSTRYSHLRTQLLVMLQTLCSSVSSGYSIEKSLMLTRPIIEHTFGKKSILIKPLIKLEQNITLHRDLEVTLDEFAADIDYPETVPVFHALGISGKIGNNALKILRSSCQMLSELSAVQDEIEAQNSGKNAEAAVLCIMPFAITFALDKMSNSYLSTARSTKAGAIILAVAFALCILSSALLFKYMTHSGKQKTVKEEKKRKSISDYKITDIVKRFFPQNFISARFELFSEISLNPKEEYERYLRKQINLAMITLVLSEIVLILTGKSLLIGPILAAAIVYFGYFDVKQSSNVRREELMRDIPLFLCLLTTLLEAGILLPRAIEICSDAFPNNKSLSSEIKNLRAMILSGVSASDAIEKLSLRIKVPEAQAALLLAARYGRLGTNEVLNLLSLQASACWSLCRNAARKKQEREVLGLLLPMTLDFICVLLVATTPAIISLGI